MRITDLLDVRSVSLDGAPKGKNEALDQIVALMAKSGKINDEEGYRKQVYAREEESTTGIGEGIAIPHGKCDAVDRPGLAAMVVKDGVEFDSLDGEPVTLMFLIAAPNTEDNVHLDVLSKLSMMLMDEEFTSNLPTVVLFSMENSGMVISTPANRMTAVNTLCFFSFSRNTKGSIKVRNNGKVEKVMVPIATEDTCIDWKKVVQWTRRSSRCGLNCGAMRLIRSGALTPRVSVLCRIFLKSAFFRRMSF